MKKKTIKGQVQPVVIRLNCWSIVNDGDPYTAPELQEPRLHGDVFGHPHFENGKSIITSRIMSRDGDHILTHSGSRYELGDIDPEYEKIFPNARKRLFDSLSV